MTSENGPGYLVPVERIEGSILSIRGERVMLDADLAAVYGVTTKALNQAVKRNRDRFPEGFIFQLTPDEYVALRSQFVTSNEKPGRGGRRHLPFAFTEHGAVMLAALLKSRRAVDVSVFVVKAFIRMRRMLADQRRFGLKLDEIESKLGVYDQNFRVVFDAIRKLMDKPKPEPQPPRKIGFHVSDTVMPYGGGGKRKKR